MGMNELIIIIIIIIFSEYTGSFNVDIFLMDKLPTANSPAGSTRVHSGTSVIGLQLSRR